VTVDEDGQVNRPDWPSDSTSFGLSSAFRNAVVVDEIINSRSPEPGCGPTCLRPHRSTLAPASFSMPSWTICGIDSTAPDNGVGSPGPRGSGHHTPGLRPRDPRRRGRRGENLRPGRQRRV